MLSDENNEMEFLFPYLIRKDFPSKLASVLPVEKRAFSQLSTEVVSGTALPGAGRRGYIQRLTRVCTHRPRPLQESVSRK